MSDRPVESMSSTFQPFTVFCDAMDFPLCVEGQTSFYGRMKIILRRRGEVLSSIRVYVDQWPRYKELPGITIVPTNGDKDSRVHCMLVDMALWAMENPATYFQPIGLMVISGNIFQDTYFLKALESLEDRYYNVLLALPQPHSSTKLPTVTFDSLVRRLRRPKRATLPAPKHRPKSRDENVRFSNGIASLYTQVFDLSQIVVFWDAKGCPTKFSSVKTVLKGKGYFPEHVLIRLYLDMGYHIPTEDWSDFVNIKKDEDHGRYIIGSEIRFSAQEGELAKVTRMLVDIVFWAMNNDDKPQNIMFISKHSEDTRCDRVMRALEDRGFNVIFEPSNDDVKSIRQETIGTFQSLCKSPRDGDREDLPKLRVHEAGLRLHGRTITKKSLRCAGESVIVFWLVEGCPSDPCAIRSRLTLALASKGYERIESIIAFVVRGKFSAEMIRDYRNAGIFVESLPVEDERQNITWLLMEFLHYTSFIQPAIYANYVVISKPFQDDLFEKALESRQLRKYNVVFEIPDYIFTYGSFLWSAQDLCSDMFTCPVKTNPETETVSYLPDKNIPSAFLYCNVFWDLTDYPFPEDLDPDLVYSAMKSTLEELGCRGEVSITAYVDKDKWPDDKKVDGIEIIPIEGDDYTRGLRMVLDIIFWTTDNGYYNPRPLGLMVISEQIKKQSSFFPLCHELASSKFHVLVTLGPSEYISRIPSTSDGSPPSLIHNVPFDSLLKSLRGSAHKHKRGDETAQLKFP